MKQLSAIPRPGLYMLKRYFFHFQKKASKVLIEVDHFVDPTAHEEEPKDLEVGISIRDLTKIYESVSDYR